MANEPTTIRIPKEQLVAIGKKAKAEKVKTHVLLKLAIAQFVERENLMPEM